MYVTDRTSIKWNVLHMIEEPLHVIEGGNPVFVERL